MPHDARDEHHLIPQWLLRHLRAHNCPLTGKRISAKVLGVTRENAKIRITRKTHDEFHGLANGATVIETYEAIDEIYALAQEGRWKYHIHSKHKTPMQVWAALFGEGASPETAKGKLQYWMYYYLFRGTKNPAGWNRVYTPAQLFHTDARLFKEIHAKGIKPSPYKRRALKALFGTDAPERIAQEDVQRVYDECIKFE